ncbi:NADH-quinone oxidoreductase subunit I [Thermotomaculum hydrothermale]|uniref:NADH-quinone oxidoreductase subunit I n=1 Tax=Thermotomaculum hydrothermale TaxID=981385 RepID=A0A7R6PV13_9BACT|nr:NADH-quinone oxidoreductase subunit I [Thermotomaculum hydrothermale]
MKGLVNFIKTFNYKDLIQGAAVTFKHQFKKTVTVQYPKQKLKPFPRFRGRLTLLKDENGEDKCVCCMACVRICPTQVIEIKPGKKEGRKTRYPEEYNFNMDRCIFCGLCVESCNFGAIKLNDEYELAQYSRKDFYFNKEKMYVPTPKVEYKK